jgi:hypothetical protein
MKQAGDPIIIDLTTGLHDLQCPEMAFAGQPQLMPRIARPPLCRYAQNEVFAQTGKTA